jgi:flagellar basal-body rod protein FlgB
MDLNKIPLLKMITTQMDWLNQRQKVLSQNIANADTPDYIARDLAPLDFADLARGQTRKLKMDVSSPSHIADPNNRDGTYRDKKDKSFTSEPSGNGVVLEEQAMLVSQTQVDYELMTRLYRKHVGMLRTALGRNV